MNLFYIDSTVRRSREFSVSNFSMTRLARTRKIEESILSLIWTTSTKILSHPLSGIESWRSNPTSILLSIYSTPISNSLPDEETWKLCWVVHSGTNFEQESQDTFILILSALTIVIFSSRIFFILIQKRRFILLSCRRFLRIIFRIGIILRNSSSKLSILLSIYNVGNVELS